MKNKKMHNPRYKAKTAKIFDVLAKDGYHVEDVEFLSGYFIFDFDKDSVVHFHVKECKGWKFAIWWKILDEEDNTLGFDFFAQYERDIDKFKPTASTYVERDVWYDIGIKSSISWSELKITQILNFIKKHPYLAWANDVSYEQSIWECDLNRVKAFVDFYKHKWWIFSTKKTHERMVKKYLKILTVICDVTLEDYTIVDMNKDGFECSPRFEVFCKGMYNHPVEESGWYDIPLGEVLPNEIKRKAYRYQKKLDKLQAKMDKKPTFEDLYDIELGVACKDYSADDLFLSVYVKNDKMEKKGKKKGTRNVSKK